MRKVSYGGTSGDYDSQLDASGKWTTTVPIISLDDGSTDPVSDMAEDSGNIRPKHRPTPKGLSSSYSLMQCNGVYKSFLKDIKEER